jgi:hypothetical protein
MSKSLVKGLIGDAAGKLTGKDFIQSLNEITITKSIAIQLIAIKHALSFGRGKLNVTNSAKTYLLERCAKSSSYIDSDTGLGVLYNEKTRLRITSDKIEDLKRQIKEEEAKILEKELAISKGRKVTKAVQNKLKKEISGAVVKRSEYLEWNIIK